MKLFLRKMFLFFGLIFTILLVCAYAFFISFELPRIKEDNIVIIGDSTGRNSVDTSIAKRYINFSQGGESYFYMYHKLKALNDKQRIDTLLISFGPNNMFDNDLLKKVGVKSRGRYIPIISNREKILLLENQPAIFLAEIIKLGKDGLYNLYQGSKPIAFGSYLANEKRYEENYHIPNTPPLFSEIELNYLLKIKEYCNENGVKLILVNFPKYYLDRHYKNFHYNFDEMRNKYFEDVDYLDFSQLYEDKSNFSDMIHLSKKGSQEFSHFLNAYPLSYFLNSNFNKKTK
ncbi:MAG: hypothetical protein Q4A00_05870 [Flavobacteriaceae bacterium]|nr:hypothetical protein [Flavobacteriaceae bacterium]